MVILVIQVRIGTQLLLLFLALAYQLTAFLVGKGVLRVGNLLGQHSFQLVKILTIIILLNHILAPRRLQSLINGELKDTNDCIDFLRHFKEALPQLVHLSLQVDVLLLWNEFLRNEVKNAVIDLLLAKEQFARFLDRRRPFHSLPLQAG